LGKAAVVKTAGDACDIEETEKAVSGNVGTVHAEMADGMLFVTTVLLDDAVSQAAAAAEVVWDPGATPVPIIP